MSTDEMRDFVNGLSESEKQRLRELLEERASVWALPNKRLF